MAALFSRACRSSPCALLQLPLSAPVRHSSVLGAAALLARQAAATTATATVTARLFHASSVAASRKPKSAVVKPTSATQSQSQSQSRPRPSSPPKKIQLPFQPHSPSAAPQNIPQSAHSPASETDAAAQPGAVSPQSQDAEIQPPTSSPRSVTPQRPAASPKPAPLAYTGANSTYQTIVEKLALSKEPTVLYTAPSQTAFILVCLTSTLFITWVSLITWKNYEVGVNQGRTALAAVGIINCSVWIAVAAYLGFGPVGLVKRIVAVPAQRTANVAQAPKPTLRFEPVALPLVKWPKPFEVPLGSAHSDRLFSLELEKFARRRKRAPGVMDEYFGWLSSIWNAYLKMFARVQRFAYVRVGKANLKLDMNGCEALDNGRILDQLIRLDSKPMNLFKKMFRSE